MYVLGFNCYAHAAAACLLRDGIPVAAVEEERLNRIKTYGDFPTQAIRYCLAEAGITMDDVAHVAFHWSAVHGMGRRLVQVVHNLLTAKQMYGSHASKWFDIAAVQHELRRQFPTRGLLPPYTFTRVHHHVSHAASAFFASPFDDAAILTMDGTGEVASTTLSVGQGTRIRQLQEVDYPHSLGFLFVALTHYLGFLPESDEYKLMSLASYGEPTFERAFQEIITLLPDGGFAVDLSYFSYPQGIRTPWVSQKFIDRFGPLRQKGEPIQQRHMDLSRALQKRLEDTALHLARHLHERTGAKNLCLAGGVALNSVMNGRLLREGPFEQLFIPPAAHDAGCSMGAALWVHHQKLGNPRGFVLRDAALGPSFSDAQCLAALQQSGLAFERLGDAELFSRTAQWLENGGVVGWFQGRVELGPRALGNRSILADPRRADMQDILNAKVKHREGFRPFAPSVLAEKARDWFDCPVESPFMLLVVPVLLAKRTAIPAVTHVDGTARMQTVRREDNLRYWQLIQAFEQRTGVPLLLNTSFNVMGEPIVCTPYDAIRCFGATDIDHLVIGNYVSSKAPAA